MGDEYGWKQVHGDVFRAPPSSLVLTSLIGAGCQLAAVFMIVTLFTIMGDLYVGCVPSLSIQFAFFIAVPICLERYRFLGTSEKILEFDN